VDQLVANEDKYVQKKQHSTIQSHAKLSYKTNLGFEHGLNLQFSTSTDIPRYDRLTETDPNRFKACVWYYGPQEQYWDLFFE
jgi:hemoglobin/transferrin/lactoferrin receptor protein